MRITSKDVRGKFPPFRGVKNSFLSSLLWSSVSFNITIKMSLKPQGRLPCHSHDIPSNASWLKEEFQEGVSFRLCCKEARCCIQITTMIVKSTVQRLPSKKKKNSVS